jgi:hypothetical protein
MMRAARVMRDAADQMERSMMRLDVIDMQLERFERTIERLVLAMSSQDW